jgi:hypothetical protein
MYSTELPGGEDEVVLSDIELTPILFKAMPKAWRDEFRKSNRSLTDESFSSLRESMMIYEEILTPKLFEKQFDGAKKSFQDSANKTNHLSLNKSNLDGHRNHNKNNHRSSPAQFGNNNNNFNRSSNVNDPKRPSQSDECPVHGKHLWSECILNPQSHNYRPRQQTSTNVNSAFNNWSNNVYRSNRGDSHATSPLTTNNNRGSTTSNATVNNPQSGDQHHAQLVPHSGIESEWSSDNF